VILITLIASPPIAVIYMCSSYVGSNSPYL
jgi:hypothetical protein